MPDVPAPTVTDAISGLLTWLREVGLLGMLLIFGWLIWTDKIHLHRDFVRSETRATKAEVELDVEQARNAQLTSTIDRLSQVLEKATGGLERSVAARIAQDEGIDIRDVLDEMASKKVGPHTRIAYPAVKSTTRKPRSRSPASRAKDKAD